MVKDAINKIQSIDSALLQTAQARLDSLTKPKDSLGRLEEFAQRLVVMTGQAMPVISKKVIFTFAGDHGVTQEGVSAFPKEVTREMVLNFIRGGAGINVLARHAGADVVVVDIGVDYDFTGRDNQKADSGRGNQRAGASPAPTSGYPTAETTSDNQWANSNRPAPTKFISNKVVYGTKNISKGPAMTRKEAEACIQTGINLAEGYVQQGYNLFGTGDMGIANTTPSSAIIAVLTGKPVAKVTGRGTGIDDDAFRNKVRIIEQAIALNKPDPDDAIDVLAKVGGAEIGGIAGLIIGCAMNRVPVVVDGLISGAGALIAYGLEPRTKDYMFMAHNSVEQGHKAVHEKIGLQPILDLSLRLGEGTGAALAMQLIEAGLKIYREMATFGEAGVSEKADA